MSMNKSDLIDHIAEQADMTKADANRALDAFMDGVQESLEQGEDVRLVGFGTFSVYHRKATKARNPQTGAVIDVAAKTLPKFKAGKNLKEAVNDNH
jgi:DNA-binding protein HU-beta